MAATCGPSGNESCCTSLLVPGGTYFRSYDGVDSTGKGYPATVSDFYLDKYEITVGRFRQFVEAGKGTQASPPAAGDGVHPLIESSGWNSAWNTKLLADTAALKAAMKCPNGYKTWTDTPGGNESRPQDCLTWYDAFAFCAWDGGRLVTDAEWGYAAAGGSEQRYYPWSSPAASTTISHDYASYDYMGDGVSGGSLADLIVVGTKPAGNGRWGHADLGGNVWEWNLDCDLITYPLPCNNCAALTGSAYRVVRGGDSDSKASDLRSAVRIFNDPLTRCVGSRCARTNP